MKARTEGPYQASARHPAAQPRPGLRRRGCAMTASAPPGGPSDVPATPSPPDANLCYPEALDWRKLEWTKGGCSFLLLSAQF